MSLAVCSDVPNTECSDFVQYYCLKFLSACDWRHMALGIIIPWASRIPCVVLIICVTCRINVRPWILKWSKRLISCTWMLVCSLVDRRIICSLWIAIIIVGIFYRIVAMLNWTGVRHMRVRCICHPHTRLSSMRRTSRTMRWHNMIFTVWTQIQ